MGEYNFGISHLSIQDRHKEQINLNMSYFQ